MNVDKTKINEQIAALDSKLTPITPCARAAKALLRQMLHTESFYLYREEIKTILERAPFYSVLGNTPGEFKEAATRAEQLGFTLRGVLLLVEVHGLKVHADEIEALVSKSMQPFERNVKFVRGVRTDDKDCENALQVSALAFFSDATVRVPPIKKEDADLFYPQSGETADTSDEPTPTLESLLSAQKNQLSPDEAALMLLLRHERESTADSSGEPLVRADEFVSYPYRVLERFYEMRPELYPTSIQIAVNNLLMLKSQGRVTPETRSVHDERISKANLLLAIDYHEHDYCFDKAAFEAIRFRDSAVKKLMRVAQKIQRSGRGGAVLIVGPHSSGRHMLLDSFFRCLNVDVLKSISVDGPSDALLGCPPIFNTRGAGYFATWCATHETTKVGMLIDDVDNFILHDHSTLSPSVVATALSGTVHEMYLDADIPTKYCVFGMTCANVEQVPVSIRQHCEIITLPPYTLEEKAGLLSLFCEARGCTISSAVAQKIVEHYCTLSYGSGSMQDIAEQLSMKFSHEISFAQAQSVLPPPADSLHDIYALECDYVNRKPEFPATVSAAIQDAIHAYRKLTDDSSQRDKDYHLDRAAKLLSIHWMHGEQALKQPSHSLRYYTDKLASFHVGHNNQLATIAEILLCFQKGVTPKPICLIGPPGVGKSSIGRIMAEALSMRYACVSVSTQGSLSGERPSYRNANAGPITKAYFGGGTHMLLQIDEIDKLTGPQSLTFLLQFLDGCGVLHDDYLAADLPLGMDTFIFLTANEIENIPEPLLNRVSVIQMPGYSYEEKAALLQHAIWPAIAKQYGLSATLCDHAAVALVSDTKDKGARETMSLAEALARKCVARGVSPSVFTADAIREILPKLEPARNSTIGFSPER